MLASCAGSIGLYTGSGVHHRLGGPNWVQFKLGEVSEFVDSKSSSSNIMFANI